MITLCKGCGAALNEAAETCLQCGMANPWFDQRRHPTVGSFRMLWDVILEPFSSFPKRRHSLQCPACDAEVEPTSVRCQCGASLQSLGLQDRSTHSLEGIGAWILLVAGLGYAGWTRIEPLVYRIAPEFRATKQGPPEVPVLITIRQTGLRITNDSAEPQSCQVEIGTFKIFHTPRFRLESREVREVSYTSFADGSAGLTEAAGYGRARESISIECMDTSGVSRRVHF